MIGIGIDTGGTYTDAVIYDFDTKSVLVKGKSRTTKEELSLGICRAMDTLPQALLEQATVLSLSTTLATNACVEEKGGRAKLILLGTSEKIMQWIDAKATYGLKPEDVLCIDSEEIFEPSLGDDPQWFQQILTHRDWLRDAQALAVAEVPAMRNGAVCERYTKAHLQAEYSVPFVMANELALDLNVMERGATALLNARLLPVIEEFLLAVRQALSTRQLQVERMIVRSDGSLMSEQVAGTYPIQTILSGPASSVIGARNLAASENSLIVDMGGTTTDISIVKDGVPAMSERISIGGYQTQIRGVYIDTFGLGGDSRITVSDRRLVLHARRVQPLCVAAAEHPEIVPQLERLEAAKRVHTLPLHECLYLVKPCANPDSYTGQERQLLEQLRAHPIVLGSGELDIYNLHTERLEAEGLVMRCGLTPTDIMHIRGDFDRFDRHAAELGARYVMRNMGETDLNAFCEQVYDMVCRKLYENILKIQLTAAYPSLFAKGLDPQVEKLISMSWEHPDQRDAFFGYGFCTKATLIGIGAPTHIFLPRVAQALHTTCIIPPHAEVANAVGAITADISAQYTIRISPNYGCSGTEGYTANAAAGEKTYETLDEAIADAREEAQARAIAEARARGAMGQLTTDVQVETNSATAKYSTVVELDTFVTASATGRFYQ